MIQIFKTGQHANRTPLSYAAFAPLFEGAITLVDTPENADILVFSHVLDVVNADEHLVSAWRRTRAPILVLSEEPFWDTIWGRRPMDRHIRVETKYGALPVTQVNHQTSNLFHFAKIPYYLLTNHRFANTYRYHFSRNKQRSASQWQDSFQSRAVDISYMFERRPEQFHSVSWPDGDLIGLCSWRTDVAIASSHGSVERLGRSWQGGAARFDLANWHLDKIVRLDGRSRMIGAFENTHQPQYLTEKLFDSFACGSMPLYFANPAHWIHKFGLPAESWMNLAGMLPIDAAEHIGGQVFDGAFFDAFHIAQTLLADLFCDIGNWIEERQRLRDALLTELELMLATSP